MRAQDGGCWNMVGFEANRVPRLLDRWQPRPTALLCALVMAVFSPIRSEACSPVHVFGVYFEVDSDVVSAGQVSRLAHWMVDLRLRYPNHESIDIGASAIVGETSPEELARGRAQSVAYVLSTQLGFSSSKIHLPSQVYRQQPESALSALPAADESVRGVQLDFLPACPHECSCQRGDPLFQSVTRQ